MRHATKRRRALAMSVSQILHASMCLYFHSLTTNRGAAQAQLTRTTEEDRDFILPPLNAATQEPQRRQRRREGAAPGPPRR